MVTEFLLHKLFEYKNAELHWKEKTTPLSRVKIGDVAGTIDKKGYRKIGINGKVYFAHRLILLYHGVITPDQVDHVNGIKHDNNFANLRLATNSNNRMNTRLASNNKSGVKNVNWHKKQSKWVVQLGVNGKKMNFGAYHDLQVAKFVADTMRHKYHGNFSRNI